MKPRTRKSPVIQFKTKLSEPQFGAPQRISKEQLELPGFKLSESEDALTRLYGPLVRVSLDDEPIKFSEKPAEVFFGPLVPLSFNS